MKINTPFQFAILSSLLISFVLVVLVYILFSVGLNYAISIENYFVIFLALIPVSFLVTYFLLELFVNQKIRLLFRMIQNYKMSKSDLDINMKEDIFASTEVEILKWAKNNSSELVKLKKEERFRRDFIGNLAHELKTPIFSIQGYILTLLEGGLEDDSVNEKFLNRALNGVERMNKIISDLDMITKFESEQIKIDFIENDIVEICNEVYDSLELNAKESKVQLTFSASYDRPIMVNCDKLKISQVIQNLVTNAIKYSEKKCEISIKFTEIGPNVLIEIEDNGPGIETIHLNRLFERFYRVDKSRARNIGGTGLGLAIVKHIVEAHGHTIQVRSTVGQGSTFFFTLTKV